MIIYSEGNAVQAYKRILAQDKSRGDSLFDKSNGNSSSYSGIVKRAEDDYARRDIIKWHHQENQFHCLRPLQISSNHVRAENLVRCEEQSIATSSMFSVDSMRHGEKTAKK